MSQTLRSLEEIGTKLAPISLKAYCPYHEYYRLGLVFDIYSIFFLDSNLGILTNSLPLSFLTKKAGQNPMRKNEIEMTPRLKKLIADLKKCENRPFTFLLIGRTGVGKSSTINSLLGAKVAPVGDYVPETREVKKYSRIIEGVQFVVIDTPGLCDGSDEEKDATYIEQIQHQVSQIDCMWFVSELGATRVTGDERKAIKIISDSFGTEVWDRAILVLTFADRVNWSEYTHCCRMRTELICKKIRKYASLDANFSIPSVAVANTKKKKTPDGEQWLSKLYLTVIKKISKQAAVPFLMGTKSRVVKHTNQNEATESHKPDPIIFSPQEYVEFKQVINIKILGGAAAGAGIGAALGSVLGPGGTAIGGGIGALIGFIVGILTDSDDGHNDYDDDDHDEL